MTTISLSVSEASLIDNAIVVIYNHNMFIIQVTDQVKIILSKCYFVIKNFLMQI